MLGRNFIFYILFFRHHTSAKSRRQHRGNGSRRINGQGLSRRLLCV